MSSREASSLLSGVNYLLPGFLVSVAALCTKHPGRRRARSPPATSGQVILPQDREDEQLLLGLLN